jgi:hypothetical protein
MRALFEDVPNNSGAVAFAGVAIQQVGFPVALPNSRRDVWFKFTRFSSSVVTCSVYRDRASTTPIIATAAITIGAGVQTVAFARAGTETPDLTGLVIVGTFFAEITGSNAYWWGYTAAPDLVVCDDIVTLLKARTGANQALDGMGTNIFAGDENAAEVYPLIAVVSQPIEFDLSTDTGSTMAIACPIEMHIVTATLKDPKLTWRECRVYQAAVESILHDEDRAALGYHVRLYYQSSQGPNDAQDNPMVKMAIVRIMAKFHSIWRDDIYPRA